jgi:hypothetical protein
MLEILLARVIQSDLIDLSDWQVAEVLNASTPSWAEANGISVDAVAVAAARASAKSVVVLEWLTNGFAPGGGVHEQVRLHLPNGSEVAPIFNLSMANDATQRANALSLWLRSNADILS